MKNSGVADQFGIYFVFGEHHICAWIAVEGEITVSIWICMCTKARVVWISSSITRFLVSIPHSSTAAFSCLPNISFPTFPINAVFLPRRFSMASTLQGAPPGFASKVGFPWELLPFSVKSIRSSPGKSYIIQFVFH